MSDQDDVFDAALADSRRDAEAAESAESAAQESADAVAADEAAAAEVPGADEVAEDAVIDPVAEFKATLRAKPVDWYVCLLYTSRCV